LSHFKTLLILEAAFVKASFYYVINGWPNF
jgi:hypothetical protein